MRNRSNHLVGQGGRGRLIGCSVGGRHAVLWGIWSRLWIVGVRVDFHGMVIVFGGCLSGWIVCNTWFVV